MSRRAEVAALAVVLLAPLAVAWPLPLVFGDALLAVPHREAGAHVWGLWAAWRSGSAPVLDTALIGFPDGVRLPLVDSANLGWFGAGLALGGVAGGYDAVVYGGLVLAGLAGALLSRRVGAPAWLGALAAAVLPATWSAAADGMTEDLAVGWVGIQLALFLDLLDHGGGARALLAAGALAAAAHAGPYHAVWSALLDGAVILARPTRLRLRRALAAGLPAALACLPLARALLVDRPEGLPGSAPARRLPGAAPVPGGFRGGVPTGADLLDPLLPLPLTGGAAEVPHTAYVGAVLAALAVVAALRERRLRPWLLGAAAMLVLSLGPVLHVAGRRVGPGPAAALVLAVPGVFGRMTRWYRAAAVAGLLLAPLAARAPRRPLRRGLAALAIAADALLLSPARWPLPAAPPPDPAPLATPPGPGAAVVVPAETSAEPPPGAWRDWVGLVQPAAGRPVQGGLMRLPRGVRARRAQAVVETLAARGLLSAETRAWLLRQGFSRVVVLAAYRALPPPALRRLERCLGPPARAGVDALVFRIEPAARDCRPR